MKVGKDRRIFCLGNNNVYAQHLPSDELPCYPFVKPHSIPTSVPGGIIFGEVGVFARDASNFDPIKKRLLPSPFCSVPFGKSLRGRVVG